MKRRLVAISMTACLMLLGCNTSRDYQYAIRGLQNELFQREQINDTLRWQLEDSQTQLAACQGSGNSQSSWPVISPGISSQNKTPPAIAPGPLGIQLGPPSEEPPKAKPGPGDGAAFGPNHHKITSIQLDKLLTGPYHSDSAHSNEGISVVIEPRNFQGQIVPVAGDVSIVVMDRSRPRGKQRIARWDFSSGEASRHFRKITSGQSMVFKLPWPKKPPQNSKLHLYVRYRTQDDRLLAADQEVRLDPFAQLSERWEQANQVASSNESEAFNPIGMEPAGDSFSRQAERKRRLAWSPHR